MKNKTHKAFKRLMASMLAAAMAFMLVPAMNAKADETETGAFYIENDGSKTYYETLSDAVTALGTAGGTISLDKDASAETTTIGASVGDVTLNLQDHTLTLEGTLTANNQYLDMNSGTVNSETGVNAIRAEGKLYLRLVEIYSKTPDKAVSVAAIECNRSTIKNDYAETDACALWVDSDGSAEINGSTVYGNKTAILSAGNVAVEAVGLYASQIHGDIKGEGNVSLATGTYCSTDLSIYLTDSQYLKDNASSDYPYVIAEKMDISEGGTVALDKDIAQYEYTGSEIKPSVKSVSVVSGNSITTLENDDLDVSYENNTDITDNAKVIVTGKNQYTGIIEKIFKIVEQVKASYEDVEPATGEITNISDRDDITTDDDEVEATIATDSSSLKSVFGITDEELAQGVNVWVEVKETTVSEESKAAFEEKLEESLGSAATDVYYIDADLFKKVGSNDASSVTTTSGAVAIRFQIPESLRKEGRTFALAREHEGTITIIGCDYDNSTGMVTFSSNQFSTYALAYSDDSSTSTGLTSSMVTINSIEKQGDKYVYDIVVKDSSKTYEEGKDYSVAIEQSKRGAEGTYQVTISAIAGGAFDGDDDVVISWTADDKDKKDDKKPDGSIWDMIKSAVSTVTKSTTVETDPAPATENNAAYYNAVAANKKATEAGDKALKAAIASKNETAVVTYDKVVGLSAATLKTLSEHPTMTIVVTYTDKSGAAMQINIAGSKVDLSSKATWYDTATLAKLYGATPAVK